MNIHEQYMRRCLALAKLGANSVAPNPMVGAVLVNDGRIIGEGYHKRYGEEHAEVNCLASVKAVDEHLVNKSTLYVSLEPCAHFGKTPPCADLIISKNIPVVVIGCSDPFSQVAGKGIEKLQQAGLKVIENILETKCKELNKRFLLFIAKKRPYIILKWAQSENGRIARADFTRVMISNEISNRLVHKWRSEEDAIMVGTNTALRDNPHLNSRLWSKHNPIRLMIDLHNRLPGSLNVFDKNQPTIVLSYQKGEDAHNISYHNLDREKPIITQILQACYDLNIQSIFVEGGSKLIQSFIDTNLWDEARVVENTTLQIERGIPAPVLSTSSLVASGSLRADTITYYHNVSADSKTT